MTQAEPGSDFFSSTLQLTESRILGGGSKHRFLARRDAGRSGGVAVDRFLLSVLVPGRDTQKRCYGKCENGSKSQKGSSKPDCPESKKTPACPSPSTPSTQPSPPGKVKFRECPPPPKPPKLPKCPPPCPPPPPPPVPKCPAVPKCPPPCAPPKNPPKEPSSPPCSPPKKKCSGRQMSTYSFGRRGCKYVSEDGFVATKLLHQRCPVFLVARRRVSFSSANFASKSNSGKNCDNETSKDSKKGEDTGNNCTLKKSAIDRCAKSKSKSKKRSTKSARDCRKQSAKKCVTDCSPKPRCPPPLPPPPSKPQVEWSPPICTPPKLIPPSPCPELSKQSVPGISDSSKPECPPPPPLPKPPCRPVSLCPCPPPPKIPPGSCPDVPTVDVSTEQSCLPPCPPKLPRPCPKDTRCPSTPICPSKK